MTGKEVGIMKRKQMRRERKEGEEGTKDRRRRGRAAHPQKFLRVGACG